MQRDIFEDLAWQHEAYAAGGIDEIERLVSQGELDREALDAWQAIDDGDVEKGNHLLLDREQRKVIQEDYQTMRDHTLDESVPVIGDRIPVGELYTRAFGWLADSPLEEGESFTEWSDAWGDNVADDDTRMTWLTDEVYDPFVDADAEVIERELDRPVDERAEEHRTWPVSEFDYDE